MSITLLKQCDGIVIKWTCPDDVETSGNRIPRLPRKFLSKNSPVGSLSGFVKIRIWSGTSCFSKISVKCFHSILILSNTSYKSHTTWTLFTFSTFWKVLHFLESSILKSPFQDSSHLLEVNSEFLSAKNASICSNNPGWPMHLLAAWMQSEALQCFHSLLICEPVPEMDSKLGLLPSSTSWFMKQRFFMNSSVLELLTTSTLVMLSSRGIASCSGDAVTSPLEIKPNQTNVQWQGKTLDYKFFQSLRKLVQLTIFHTPTHLQCQQRVEIKGQIIAQLMMHKQAETILN